MKTCCFLCRPCAARIKSIQCECFRVPRSAVGRRKAEVPPAETNSGQRAVRPSLLQLRDRGARLLWLAVCGLGQHLPLAGDEQEDQEAGGSGKECALSAIQGEVLPFAAAHTQGGTDQILFLLADQTSKLV